MKLTKWIDQGNEIVKQAAEAKEIAIKLECRVRTGAVVGVVISPY